MAAKQDSSGFPTNDGLWVDKDTVLWVAERIGAELCVRRLWDTSSLPDAMLQSMVDVAAYQPLTPVMVDDTTGDYVTALTDDHGLYRDQADGDLWAKNGDMMRLIQCHGYWMADGQQTPIVGSPFAPWRPVAWHSISETEKTVSTNRIISFPPVASFGRLERDKWLPLKTLEESAELVEASKRWLKTNSADDRTDMLAELADVIQTLANLIVTFNITYQELTDALQECLERNRQKGRL